MSLAVNEKPCLRDMTTLGLGGHALAEAVLRDEADLDQLARFMERYGGRPFVLGGGSNLLAEDHDLDLVLLHPAKSGEPEACGRAEDKTLVRCRAGLGLPSLLNWLRQRGLSGMEGFSGIPGSVGGAVAMNAGSYGVEMGHVLHRARLWTPARGLFWVEAGQCEFGYRHFSPGPQVGRFVVWEVEVAVAESTNDAVTRATNEHHEKKKATQPIWARSAGCVFKNPQGQSAGRLLDQAGFKGRRLGDMAFSELHANFLVNLGQGRSDDALELMFQAVSAVRERFGIELQTEVVVLS